MPSSAAPITLDTHETEILRKIAYRSWAGVFFFVNLGGLRRISFGAHVPPKASMISPSSSFASIV